MLLKLDAMVFAIELILIGHGQLFGCNEVESGVEMAHGHDERVHRSTVFEVAHKVNVEVFERSLRLIYGVKVEHAL